MQPSCVRQNELPQVSRLAADVSYNPERCAAFYRHAGRGLASYQAAAKEINLPDGRRAELIAALRQLNPPGGLLDRLAQPGTVAVITGQQAGLFTGPAYTIYKALHTIRLASWLSENGVPAVPVFWLATEDHDFDEADHAWVFNADHSPAKVGARITASGQPVGPLALPSPPVDQLKAAMEGLPFRDEVVEIVAECYQPGATMGAAFGALLRRLLRPFDILQADPMLPSFRALAAPLLRAYIEAAPELSARVLERGRELAAAGYHSQVHVEQDTSFAFLLEKGKRLALRRNGAAFTQNGRHFSARELADRAESLSPNALLRPVVQDSMFPTVAYVGGPSEVAYLAQSEALYGPLLGRMPVAVPRAGFTLLDQRSAKLFDRYGLKLDDFFHGEERLRDKISAQLTPPGISGALRAAADAVTGEMERVKLELSGLDATLAKAAGNSARKIGYQFQKLERKAAREALARDERAARDARSLSRLVCPGRHLQERLYSILPFVAKHGLDLAEALHAEIDPACPDHRLIAI